MPRRLFTDDEDPIFLLHPGDNVYSYFMFIAPTDAAKRAKATGASKHGMNWDILIGYVLVGLNFLLQGILLYTIFNTVVMANEEWMNGIYSVGGENWNLLAPKDPSKCNDGGSLCFSENGKYSCAPPSVQLTGRWDELDTNADGIWTREEVVAAKEELQCKYVVNPVEVFDVFISFLKMREKIIWLHPDVKAGNAIHLPYFQYAMGDIVMCGYRSKDMCANLVKAGFFHAPLKYGTAPRVGTSIDSALKYCWNLLSAGGVCDTTLPSTYSVWKIESEAQCGSPSYDKFTYTNPGNNITKSLLSVDYQARKDYELSQTVQFRLFKGVVIMLWLVGMGLEVREISMILTMVMKYPDADEMEARGEDSVIEEADPADPEDVRYRIMGIERSHRMSIGALTVVRLLFTLVLTWVGCVFLMKQIDYIEVLFDAVALLYIVEIANLLYSQVLREEVRDQTEDIKPMRVTMYGLDYLNRRPALVDIITLSAIITITVFLIEMQLKNTVIPVYGALECTCVKTGEKCVEAQKFDFDFWHHYWKITVPAIFEKLKELKANPGSVNFLVDTPPLPRSARDASAAAYGAKHAQRLLNKNHHHWSGKLSHRFFKKPEEHVSSSSVVKQPEYMKENVIAEAEYFSERAHHSHQHQIEKEHTSQHPRLHRHHGKDHHQAEEEYLSKHPHHHHVPAPPSSPLEG